MTQPNHSFQEERSAAKSMTGDPMVRSAVWGAALLTSAGLLFAVVGFMIAEINMYIFNFLSGDPFNSFKNLN